MQAANAPKRVVRDPVTNRAIVEPVSPHKSNHGKRAVSHLEIRLREATSNNTALTGTVAALVDTGTLIITRPRTIPQRRVVGRRARHRRSMTSRRATPGYSRGDGRSHRYRVRGQALDRSRPRWTMRRCGRCTSPPSKRRRAAESRVAAPRRSAARVVAAAAPEGRWRRLRGGACRGAAHHGEMVRAVWAPRRCNGN